MFELLRAFFGPARPVEVSWRHEVVGIAITLAIAALAAWLIADAVEGRGYPFSQGRLVAGASFAWLAVMRGRAILARQLRANPIGGPVTRALGTLLSRLTIMALVWYPGLATGWYALEAENRPSTNSQGTDVCAVSTAQFCMSGPRALIPWAILLLVASAFITWFFFKAWTTASRRDPEPTYDPRAVMLAQIQRVFPEAKYVDPGDEPAPATASGDVVDDLERLARMHEAGHLTREEFDEAKRRLLG